jgi:hypothetical protein
MAGPGVTIRIPGLFWMRFNLSRRDVAGLVVSAAVVAGSLVLAVWMLQRLLDTDDPGTWWPDGGSPGDVEGQGAEIIRLGRAAGLDQLHYLAA